MSQAAVTINKSDGRLEIQDLEMMEADTVLGWIADYLMTQEP